MINVESKISVEKFESTLKNQKLVMVDFFATWCGPCKMFSPIVEQVADKYEGQVCVLKIDVDENPDISEKYEIQSIPTLMIFKDGVMVERNTGVLNLNQCSELIDKYLD